MPDLSMLKAGLRGAEDGTAKFDAAVAGGIED
jgi:hypothetical protein